MRANQGCRLRGYCFVEISEPWSRAGFVQMQPVRVLTGLDAQVLPVEVWARGQGLGLRFSSASTPDIWF